MDVPAAGIKLVDGKGNGARVITHKEYPQKEDEMSREIRVENHQSIS
jgi:hypothetical protein